MTGGSVMVGGSGGAAGMVYATGNGVVYATPPVTSLADSNTPILLNFPSGLLTHDQSKCYYLNACQV